METVLSGDLNSVRREFENWRATRKGRERIPENLWAAAISMLDYYRVGKVRRELKLNLKQLQNRAKSSGKITIQNRKPKQAFVEVSGDDLVKTLPLAKKGEVSNALEASCQIVFERVDGSKLSLNLPIEWNQLQLICNGFLKA